MLSVLQHTTAQALPIALLLPASSSSVAAMSGSQGSGAQASFPPPSGTARSQPARQGPSSAQALRALLQHSDDSIVPALIALPISDLARLHDLVSGVVFGLLVNPHGPAQDAPSVNRDPWADIQDPPPVAASGPPVAPPQPNPVNSYPPGSEQYFWRDPIPPLSPRRATRPPWTSDEGWIITPVLPAVPSTMLRPAWWPYPDIFCLKPSEIPGWIELQEPADPVSHLPLRGYCSHVCSVRNRSANCYGLCLRPVMVGERDGHSGHKCFACLKAHAE